MTTEPETRVEWEAKWVVSSLLAGVPTRREPPGHDYDIRVGARIVALEVTLSSPEARNSLQAKLKDLHKAAWSDITTTWQLTIRDEVAGRFAGPDLRPIANRAPALLRILEEHGIWGFGRGHEWQIEGASPMVLRAIQELLGLGLVAGHSTGPLIARMQPQILIGMVSGGCTGPEDVVEAVEVAAERKAEQLGKAAGDERHLFVLVDVNDYGAHQAMVGGLGRLPDRAPRLPRGIDVVWAGAWLRGAVYGCDVSPIWRVTAGGPWERVDVPDAHGYAAAHGEPWVMTSEEAAREALRRELIELANGVRSQLGIVART